MKDGGLTEKIKYSILMSVYNKEKPEWLEYSIKSMLNQTIKCDEFVLVEDGPLTIELYETIKKINKENPKLFKIIKLKENVGLGPALKIGILNCSNEYIARMDTDDYSKPNRIEEQFAILKQNPEISLIGTNVEEFEGNIKNIINHVVLPEKNEDIYTFSKRRCPFRHPSILFKKSEVISAGNYRDWHLCEDYDMWIRMIEKGVKCYNIQKPLVYMRINENFYKRRGGIKYLKNILKFKTEKYREGFFSLRDYIVSSGASICVCLAPNIIRKKFYEKYLRK